MLQAIRERATGVIAYVIIILICIPFALWGVNSYISDAAPADAAHVGEATISLNEVQRAYQQQRQRLQQMFGANFNPANFDETTMKQQALQQLIDDAVIQQAAGSGGMRVGDEQLNQAIQGISAFHDEGQFNVERYQRLLSAQGLSPPQFEESYRNELVTNQLREGLINSSLLTQSEIDSMIELMRQRRTIRFFTLPLSALTDEIEIADDAVSSYYDENKNRFVSPENAKIQYLELSLDELAKNIEVSDDTLQQEYEARERQYRREEERSASHILFSVAEDADDDIVEQARQRAQSLFEEIGGGKTFAEASEELATDSDVEVGELGVIFKSMMEPAFEKALFGLTEVGDVSEPAKTTNGFHLVQLDEIKPEQVTPFDEVKDELLDDLQKQRAENQFYDATDQLGSLTFENADSLAPAAEALGIEIKESAQFTANEGEGVAGFSEVRRIAFSPEVLEQGLNSESIEVEPGHVVVLRQLEHNESKPLSLEESREQVIEQLKNERGREALDKQIADLLERARNGEAMEQLAESAEVELQQPEPIERNGSELPANVVRKAFEVPAPAAGQATFDEASLANGDRAVIAVTEVAAGNQDDIPEAERESTVQRIASQIGSSEFDAYLQAKRQQTEIVTFDDRL